MLSPASHRVCCLAVMAPALTKADRRTDCLPVVLSDPFCVSETEASDNRNDKINEFTLTKLPNKFACLLNKRKPFMHKSWFRNYIRNSPELTDKTRFSTHDLRKSLLNSKVRIYAETKNKSWHGTNVTLAVADKVRLKYIMNKNNSTLKNMGLARANTTLGLHSMRKMNRITQISPRDKDDLTNLTQESGDSLPVLPDSTNSELETAFTISMIVEQASEHSSGEVSSSCGDLFTSSDPKPDAFSPAIENVNLPENASTLSASPEENCSIPLSSAEDDATVTQSETKLPVTLTDSDCFSREVNNSDATESVPVNTPSNCINSITSLPPTACGTRAVNDNDTSEIRSSLVSSSPTHCDIPLSPVAGVQEVKLKDSSVSHLDSFSSLPSTSCDIPASLEREAVSPDDLASPLSPKSDIDTDSAACSFSSLSTLSANASPEQSLSDEGAHPVFITFPDDFLSNSSSPKHPSIESEVAVYSSAPCLSPKSPTGSSCYRDGLYGKEPCCAFSKQDLLSLQESLKEQEARLVQAIDETEALMRKYTVAHVQGQLQTFVRHYKNEFAIPCQRPAKVTSTKSSRDMVGLKAELLQSEDVKSLSTAALVSLVRKLESSSSQGNLLLPQNPATQDTELSTNDTSALTFTPVDCSDIKKKSRAMLTSVRNLLRSADPDLTESSEEEEISDTEPEAASLNLRQKRGLWKFLKERAALTSHSTWLIARIHELENQLRTLNGIIKKVSSTVRDVCLEERRASESSALSTAGSGDASLQIAIKQNKTKHLSRPVNGYLDHSSISSASHIGQTSDALRLDRKLSSASAFLESRESCSRTRPLKTSTFQKRKVMVTTGLHLTNSRHAKLSTVGCVCNCQDEMLPCVLCTGRYNCVQSVDPDTLPLLDRVALLDPDFHPLLSFEKDIPLLFYFENILKKNEAQYQSVRPVSPIPNHRRLRFGTKQKHFDDVRSRTRKLNRYARSLLSAKYRNKKHFRKHKLVFGKWRKLQNKNSFHARNRIRRLSIASSASSHDSPVHSPMSQGEDGFGPDGKRKRDDNQFDIDDVIIPYSSKRGRLVKFEFKDIEIPSWRPKALANLESGDMEEDLSDAAFIKRHENYEIEERKIIRNGGDALCFFNTWQKRASRQNRSDSRADSSGANTPDPVLLYDQDIMFQDPNSLIAGGSPLSPVSPPMTPSSALILSDDSQPSVSGIRFERKKPAVSVVKRTEDSPAMRMSTNEYVEVQPYERRVFPLTGKALEEFLTRDSDHNKEDTDVTVSGPSCPASPMSTTSTTSTVEAEDITDPEWTVVKKESGPDQALVLKFAKR